jgi:hypothetical protein
MTCNSVDLPVPLRPDEPDALAVDNRKPRAVEQRGVAVREMSVEEG